MNNIEHKNYNNKSYALGATGSAIRELFEFGKKRKQEIGADNVFDYSLGNPSIPCPDIVNETLINLIKNTDATLLHGYTSGPGDMNVRNSIASYLNKTYGCSEKGSLIYMTCGAAASLTVTFNALIASSNDEVIVFAPFFPEYRVFIEKANGIVKVVKSREEDLKIDFEKFEGTINENTKAVLINSPNNPSGVVYTEEDIKKLSAILYKKEKEYNHPIFLISDEPYRELVYNMDKVPFVTNYYDDAIVCYSFSKSISLPGERIGYILVSNKCNDAINVYKAICGSGRSLGFVCAPALFQYMIPSILGYTSNIDEYKKNKDYLYNELKKIGYDAIYPDGAFYMFVKALEDSASNFSERAKKHELLIVPSDSFGFTGYVRLSYCVSFDMIKRSIPAFKALFDEYKKEK